MAHSLLLGMTESGKTTLGTRMCHTYYQNNFNVIVLDPMCDPRWKPPGYQEPSVIDQKVRAQARIFQTSDSDAFLKVFWGSQNCMVFIDESGDTVGRYDLAMQQTATKGRHWGHSVHFLSQRGAQINRTVRDQCSHLFLFNTASKDSKLHAEEWNAPILEEEGPKLRQGEYFHVVRFDAEGEAGKIERGMLFQTREVK